MTPDYFEPITAYRVWDVNTQGGMLMGQAVQEPWPTRKPIEARCAVGHYNAHRVLGAHLTDAGDWLDTPVMACGCGIHAFKALEMAIHRALHPEPRGFWNGDDSPKPVAWGEVKIWGRVVEHEIGFRAQFAYPSRLFVLKTGHGPDPRRIEDLYSVRCEAVRMEEIEQAARNVFNGDPGAALTIGMLQAAAARMQTQMRTMQQAQYWIAPTARLPRRPLTAAPASAALVMGPPDPIITLDPRQLYHFTRLAERRAQRTGRSWRDILKEMIYAYAKQAPGA